MASHVAHTHTIEIPGRVDDVLRCFTPEGEESWVDGWAPHYLHPAGKETRERMVFRTHHGGEETLWACVRWDPVRGEVAYVRVTPGSRFGFVTVRCRALGEARTSATVSYELTALGAAGDETLGKLTAEAYRAMIEGWREKLERKLGGGGPATTP